VKFIFKQWATEIKEPLGVCWMVAHGMSALSNATVLSAL
jgi:hypothetical protein